MKFVKLPIKFSALPLATLIFLFFGFGSVVFGANVCQPQVAGRFYPENKAELQKMIGGFIAVADPQEVEGEIFALISPHAGYQFSGSTAAFGYKLIKNKPYKLVIIMAPSHHESFDGVAVFPGKAFRTPLGEVSIDTAFAKRIIAEDSEVVFSQKPYLREHALETQLPFLQSVLSGFKVVPLIFGDCTLSTCQRLAEVLKKLIAGRSDVLVVVSSDFYHGYDFQEAAQVDRRTISFIEKMDAEGLYFGLRQNNLQMCGGFGAVTALLLAKELGHKEVFLLKTGNSAEATGIKIKGEWTVGYTSIAIDRPEQKGAKVMFNQEQRKRLLEIARNSISQQLAVGKKLELTETDPDLQQELGAFVTLHKDNALRGCIGNMVVRQPLYLTIRDMALEAAFGDPRFSPLTKSELAEIEIEISVLSPLKRVFSADDIEIGKHGVVVAARGRSGVYLPQVAQETGWSKEEFLSSLCRDKAGLPADAWKDKTTELYVFTAEVFSEKNY